MPTLTGRLVIEEDAAAATVWLYWCRGEQKQRTLKVLRALRAAAKRGAGYCHDAVDRPFPPASTPGQPPRRRTGEGQASIEWGDHRGRWAGYVRTAMPGEFNYMAFHDQREREWLYATLSARAADLERIVAQHLQTPGG